MISLWQWLKANAVEAGMVAVLAFEATVAALAFHAGAWLWGAVDAAVGALYAQWLWSRMRRRRDRALGWRPSAGDEEAVRLSDGYFRVSPEVARRYGAEALRKVNESPSRRRP